MARFRRLVCWLGIGVLSDSGMCDFTVTPAKIAAGGPQPYDRELEERIYELESRVSLAEHIADRQEDRQQGEHRV